MPFVWIFVTFGMNRASHSMQLKILSEMIESTTNFIKGFKPPFYHEVRVTFLKKLTELMLKI